MSSLSYLKKNFMLCIRLGHIAKAGVGAGVVRAAKYFLSSQCQNLCYNDVAPLNCASLDASSLNIVSWKIWWKCLKDSASIIFQGRKVQGCNVMVPGEPTLVTINFTFRTINRRSKQLFHYTVNLFMCNVNDTLPTQ
jgi:hypothetical protein